MHETGAARRELDRLGVTVTVKHGTEPADDATDAA